MTIKLSAPSGVSCSSAVITSKESKTSFAINQLGDCVFNDYSDGVSQIVITAAKKGGDVCVDR